MWIIAIVAVVLIAGLAILLTRLGGGKFPWLKFYVQGKESGFIFHEINLLRKLAIENRLENPLALFWSIKQLDRCIKGMIIKARAQQREDDPVHQVFLAKLFDFRKRVEFNLPKYKIGLTTTRKMPMHQKVKLTLPGGGTFVSSIVENLRKYLAISYPQGGKMPPNFSWKNQKINVYFWRAEDAGYVFQSHVMNDFIDQKYPILHIAHSDNLVRSQKRGSIRVDTDRSAHLFALQTIENANEELEKTGGLRCRLMDISEDGAAALIGGRAKVGLPVKIQFVLAKDTLVMCGIVKGTTFNQKKNQSLLHIQSVPPSPKVKNNILSYVYNLFGERDVEDKLAGRKRPSAIPASGPVPRNTVSGGTPGAAGTSANTNIAGKT